MSDWQEWFAWRPVNLCHYYANCPCTAWLCLIFRKKVNGRWVYADSPVMGDRALAQ